MKILHTADWHLADRLKQIDRTADLQRAVEHIATLCQRESVDLLLIAGDLFSELARPEALQLSLAHLSQTFRPFLLRGGTIIAIAGNHDNDIYCETLRRAFQLAAPSLTRPGDMIVPGRFYLTTRPVHFKLRDARGLAAQFVCMPYPTTNRYLHGQSATAYTSFDQRRQMLRQAFLDQLDIMRAQLAANLPAILMAHVNVLPPNADRFFKDGLDDDIIIADRAITDGWTYVALGHLHGPGKVLSQANVRYSGSIDRLSITEKDQQKSVVLVTIESQPWRAHTRLLPVPATPFYDVCITHPSTELPMLDEQYPQAQTALVRCHVRYDHRNDNLHEILAEISRLFPRCYERTWSESSESPRPAASIRPTASNSTPSPSDLPAGPRETAEPALPAWPDTGQSTQQTVLGYLDSQLAGDRDREAILLLVRQLLEELQ